MIQFQITNSKSLVSEIIITASHEALYHMPSQRDGLAWGVVLFLPYFYQYFMPNGIIPFNKMLEVIKIRCIIFFSGYNIIFMRTTVIPNHKFQISNR